MAFSLLGLSYAGWVAFSSFSSTRESRSASLPVKQEPFFRTPWQDETEYAVWAITDELARMCFYAGRNSLPANLKVEVTTKNPDPDHPVYLAKVDFGDGRPPVVREIDVSNALWSGENYGPLAKALLTASGFKNRNPVQEDENLLLATDLQNNFTAVEIQKQNELLSKALTRDFCNPRLHDEAAVLAGTFPFREFCNYFADVRPALNCSTVHLAMAEALRGDNGGTGTMHRLALALNELAMNRQAGALKIGQELPSSLEPWKTAIQVKATGDWRTWKEVPNRTRLENLAFFNAKCRAVSTPKALAEMKRTGYDQQADWLRILNLNNPSIAIGHSLLDSALEAEIQEINDVHKAFFGAPATKEKFTEDLNPQPGHCLSVGADGAIQVHAIDWGLWADFLQRHLCEAIYDNYHFIMVSWGNPEAGPGYLSAVKALHNGLRLDPLLRKMLSDSDTNYLPAMRDSYELLHNFPQTVPVRTWNMLCYYPIFKKGRDFPDNVLPHINEWHRFNPPPGAAIDMESRIDHPSLTGRKDWVDKLAALRAIAPADNAIAAESRKCLFVGLSEAEGFRKAFGYQLPWSPDMQASLANLLGADDPQAFELMKTATELDPDLHFVYAQFLVAAGKRDEAALEYEKGFQQSRDAVTAANNACWLVMYYADNGRMEEAEKLADFAAGVYSYSGLETKAALMERLGKNEEAEEYYKKIQERYGASGPLTGFHLRLAVKSGNNEMLSQVAGNIFSNGIKKVTLADMPATQPERGVGIYGTSPSLTKAGLRPNDVIVALDGIRVETFAQYDFVRSLTRLPEMKIIAWQDGKYREFVASPPNRKFGVNMDDYVR